MFENVMAIAAEIFIHLKLLGDRFIEALFSLALWVFFWCFAFFGGTAVALSIAQNSHNVTEATALEFVKVSALAVTISVMAGHVPKLMSYVFGFDTDFRMIGKDSLANRFSITNVKGYRLLLSVFCLYVIVTQLSLAGNINVVSEDPVLKTAVPISYEFVKISQENWSVVLSFLFAQFVFCWPEPHQQPAKSVRELR